LFLMALVAYGLPVVVARFRRDEARTLVRKIRADITLARVRTTLSTRF
jgi:hypothetical protein